MGGEGKESAGGKYYYQVPVRSWLARGSVGTLGRATKMPGSITTRFRLSGPQRTSPRRTADGGIATSTRDDSTRTRTFHGMTSNMEARFHDESAHVGMAQAKNSSPQPKLWGGLRDRFKYWRLNSRREPVDPLHTNCSRRIRNQGDKSVSGGIPLDLGAAARLQFVVSRWLYVRSV
jgi:hypothetical protein